MARITSSVLGLDGTSWWKDPDEILPKLTNKYFVWWDDPADEEYLQDGTALFSTLTGKWTIKGVEVDVVAWADPYLMTET